MEETIRTFADQFSFKPEINNALQYTRPESFVVGGMGGSHLAAGLLKIYNPDLDLYIHRDYGLPSLSHKKLKESLFIGSSYSGNTEETINFAQESFGGGYKTAVIATGGKLIDYAKEKNLPYIQLPATGIQPRNALGFSLIALAKLVGDENLLLGIHSLEGVIDSSQFEEKGGRIAENIRNKIPVIYSSRINTYLAYNWKIKLNETAKSPAFYNVFPELNHNEMTGFDVATKTAKLDEKFHFIFLRDSSDHPEILKSMDITKKMYEDRGFKVDIVDLEGTSPWEKIFNSLLLADWVALKLSRMYGTEAEKVPMIEEFKKLIS